MYRLLCCSLCLLVLLKAGDEHGAGCVAGDVEGGTTHIEELINACDNCDTFNRNTDGGEYHCEHNHACAGNTCGADGSEGCSEDDHCHLTEGQLHAEAGGNEYSCNCLIDCGAVHVDGCAERQNEGADFGLCTHLVAALNVDGQGSVGGSGGECSNHCRSDALEELEGAHAAEELDAETVNKNNVDNVADVGNANDERESADDGRTVNGNNVAHESKNADRGNADDHHHDLHDDFICAVDEVADKLALFTCSENTCTKENGNADYGQHIAFNHGLEEVIGEYIYDNVHNCGGFGSGVFKAAQCRAVQRMEEALEDVYNNEADYNGKSGGADVVYKGLNADAANALEVLEVDDAVSNGAYNNGNNQELQQVDVDGTDGLNPGSGKVRKTCLKENEACKNTGEHTDKYPCGQGEFALGFHEINLLIKL